MNRHTFTIAVAGRTGTFALLSAAVAILGLGWIASAQAPRIVPAGPPVAFASLVQSAGGDVICALHADAITGMPCNNQVTDGTTETAFTNGVLIPANALSANTASANISLLVHASGATPTFTVRLRLGGIGGTEIYRSATTTPAAGNNVASVACTISALAAASATTPLVVACSQNTFSATATTRNALLSNTTQSVAADTTTAKTLVVTIAYSANTADNAIGLYSISNGLN